ncbi:MAG: methyltransferase domain-containing protein [Pirellulales bacterium]
MTGGGALRALLHRLNRHQWGLWELRTIWLDLRLGGYAGGRRESRFRHLGAAPVDNIPYRVVSSAMDAVSVAPEDVLVDVGCGLGRVLNWWLSRGWSNRMVGIELDPDVAARVRRRLRGMRNIEIISGDAVAFTPADATICFMFNPFNRAVMERWHDAVLARHSAPRLTVVYVNCHHLDVFRASNRWNIAELARHPADHCKVAIVSLRK